MTYDAREKSIQDGQPVELYKMLLSGRTYYMTSAEEDVQFGGYSWQATPGLSRSPITLKKIGEVRTLDVTIGRQHQAAAILMSNGIPPRTATLQIKRVHRGDTEARQIWSGPISRVTLRGTSLNLTIPNAMDTALSTTLPPVVSGTCRHMLYGPGCEVDRNYPIYMTQGHLVAATVVSQVGDVLTISSMPHADGWAKFGEVSRLVDGERRTILKQFGTALTLDVPFAYLAVGDSLAVWHGCAHNVDACHDDFNNAQNFGGEPDAPLSNPVNFQDNS